MIPDGVVPDLRLERGFACALNQTSEALAILDAQAETILHGNAAFSQVFYGPGPRRSGQGLLDLFQKDGHYLILSNALTQAGAGHPWKGRLFLRPRSSRELWFDVDLAPVCNGQGAVESLVARFRDVSLESEQDWQTRLTQRMGTLGALARGVAHDFNNLIGVILSSVELMETQVEPDHPIQRRLATIRQVGVRAKDLSAQVMHFSRRSEAPWGPVNLSGLVKEVTGLLQSTLPENIQVLCDIAEGLEVPGEASQLHQVIINLGLNASQAMQPGGGQLCVHLQELGSDLAQGLVDPSFPGPCIRLTVQDTGCGMSSQTLERIFEPFFTTKSEGRGTGLGLAVVHDIVQRHRGSLKVSSRPGQGSSFQVFLPTFQERRQSLQGTRSPTQDQRPA